MRLILLAVLGSTVSLLAACASNPQPAVPQASPPAAAAPTPASADAKGKYANIDATNLADAQRAGYKVVNENGKKLYCKRSAITGTRLHQQTTCLTEEEMEAQRRDVQETMHPVPIPMPTRQ